MSLPERLAGGPMLALWVLACGLGLPGCGADERRPNVLLVSIDTLRADHLSSYGYVRETAPTLTRLAGEGALFANATSQASSTVPTHASLFTGRFPFQHGAYHVGLAVQAEELTLAERFRQLGYRTFGGASSIRFRGRTGFDQGFDVFERFDELPKNDRSRALTDRLLAWIGEEPGPWFAFAHYFDPHQPYAPPEPFRSRWHPGLPAPAPEKTSDYLYFHDRPDREVPADVLAYLRALYDGEILFLDAQLERLVEALSPEPGEAPTLVVVTSDHGEEFKEHGGLSHAKRLHEELLRVPLLFWWPGRIPAGTRVETPAQTVDVLPTLLELAVGEAPPTVPGRSFAARLLSRDAEDAAAGADVVLAQIRPSRWSLTASLEGSRYKYVSRDDAPHRLFDLAADPGERRDLLYDRPEVADRLRELAAALGVEAEAVAVAPEPVSPETMRRLREIGYVDEAREVQRGLPPSVPVENADAPAPAEGEPVTAPDDPPPGGPATSPSREAP